MENKRREIKEDYIILVDNSAQYKDVLDIAMTVSNITKGVPDVLNMYDITDKDKTDKVAKKLAEAYKVIIVNGVKETTREGDLSDEMLTLAERLQEDHVVYYLNHVHGATNNYNYSISIAPNNEKFSGKRLYAEILPARTSNKVKIK